VSCHSCHAPANRATTTSTTMAQSGTSENLSRSRDNWPYFRRAEDQLTGVYTRLIGLLRTSGSVPLASDVSRYAPFKAESASVNG